MKLLQRALKTVTISRGLSFKIAYSFSQEGGPRESAAGGPFLLMKLFKTIPTIHDITMEWRLT